MTLSPIEAEKIQAIEKAQLLVALTRFASEIHLNGRQLEFLYSSPKKLKESTSDATYNAEPGRCQSQERLVQMGYARTDKRIAELIQGRFQAV
jgi:hypothetical protein